MPLKCVSRFKNDWATFEPGEIIELSEDQESLLMRSSPASFERIVADAPEPIVEIAPEPIVVKLAEVAVATIEEPIQHRQIRRRTSLRDEA